MRNKGSRIHHNYKVGQQVIEQGLQWSRARRAIPVTKIRAIMLEKGISQADIAERLAITNASVSRLLSGKQNLTLETLFKLADAVEEDISIVIGKL